MEVIKNCAGMIYAGNFSFLLYWPIGSCLPLLLLLPVTAGAESVSLLRPWSISFIWPTLCSDGQTVSALATFVLAIVTHPEVQIKAQKELDSVVGRDRLPEFGDRQSLPYIDAIVKEVLR